MKTIGENIENVYAKIEKRYKVCFFAAIICGLLTHIYVMTNHLYNYDELWHTPVGFGTGLEVGRWALSITVFIQKILFKNAFTIPVVNGTITILLYSVTACLVVSVLDVYDTFWAGMIGALMITFPALVCRMFFMFTTHYYAIGIVMVALGVYVVTKVKHSVLSISLAVLLATYGMAIYQANFVTGVCMMVGFLLIRFIREDYDLKIAVRDCVSCVVYLGICMVLFLVGSKATLAITGKQMESYENLDKMGQINVSQLVEGIVRCYKTFVRTAIKDVYAVNPNRIVCVTFGVCIIALMYTIVKTWTLKRQTHMKVLITLIIAVLPIAVNLIIIMAISSGTMYSIMVYELVFMFVIPIACLDSQRIDYSQSGELREGSFLGKCYYVLNSLTAFLLCSTVLTYIWFANGNYLAMEYTNMHDNAYYQTMMTQIKSLDGYRDDMKLVVIGKPTDDMTNSSTDLIGETFHIGGKAATNVAEYSSWAIMSRVLGFNPEVDWSDEAEAYYKGLDEFSQMPNYPDSGSIKIIDDIVVVKLSGED